MTYIDYRPWSTSVRLIDNQKKHLKTGLPSRGQSWQIDKKITHRKLRAATGNAHI